jgi:cysteine sulfinate desulfinase/cysteine desulfurase-like protein
MGIATEWARGAVRLTLGYDTAQVDVDRALAVVPAMANALRTA